MSITVKKIENPRLHVKVSLKDPIWQELHPNHLASFLIIELLRPCNIYPDGLFPGAEISKEPQRQSTRVYCFSNYLEWSRITQDDVRDCQDEGIYLTTHFFDQRKKGWSEITHTTKLGQTVGYCFNGIAYGTSDIDSVRLIVYKTVYKGIIKDKSAFKRLREIIQEAEVELSGADVDVLRVIAETLLSSNEKAI